MKELKTTQGTTVVDDDMFDELNKYHWHITSGGYVARSQHIHLGLNKRTNRTVRLHRVVLNAPDGMEVDHINGNKLDNRRINLRLATRKQNTLNRGLNKNSRTGFKGVCIRSNGKFRVVIGVKGKRLWLGTFADINQAIEVRKKAEEKYYGEFSRA